MEGGESNTWMDELMSENKTNTKFAYKHKTPFLISLPPNKPIH